MMHLTFSRKAIKNIAYWEKHNKKILKKISSLFESIIDHPFEGIGKPEPLKHQYTGYWSRRIDSKHRLVYKVETDTIMIISCRLHYNDN